MVWMQLGMRHFVLHMLCDQERAKIVQRLHVGDWCECVMKNRPKSPHHSQKRREDGVPHQVANIELLPASLSISIPFTDLPFHVIFNIKLRMHSFYSSKFVAWCDPRKISPPSNKDTLDVLVKGYFNFQ
ncbi:unnamed protein product [Sphenostylis stenocarpa]|uniref:Uncharacterized protein n=1 Tax=Sphenostylis stenocarpa TaxID=92480 RepID=A0AA86SLL1_9FABA|nr:unnamed protein product [Sphenostylis stenocarpa]